MLLETAPYLSENQTWEPLTVTQEGWLREEVVATTPSAPNPWIP